MMNRFIAFAFSCFSIAFGCGLSFGARLDVQFAPVFENGILPINTQDVQDDGNIVIGGSFKVVNGRLRHNLARVLPDGTLDPTFDIGIGPDAVVQLVRVQTDGKIIIAGLFTTYNGISRPRLARLNHDGSLDTTFAPVLNGSVHGVDFQSDDKVIIVGNFTSVNGTAMRRIARLNNDGTLDPSFDPGTGTNAEIRTVAVQPDQRILFGGDFTTYNGLGLRFLGRLNSDGAVDTTFMPGDGPSNRVYGISLNPDGSFYIAGDFNSFNGTGRNLVARIDGTGKLDTSFNAGFAQSNTVVSAKAQSSGKVIAIGSFLTVGGLARRGIVRLNPDGSVDTTFEGPGTDGGPLNVSVLKDDRLVISGGFGTYNGQTAIQIARIMPNGSLDPSLAVRPGASGSVTAIALQSDGKILAAGSFLWVSDVPRRGIVRLFPDGTVDPSFDPGSGISGEVTDLIQQDDGKIVIVGNISSYDGVSRYDVVRINPDGSLDTTFDAGVTNEQAILDRVVIDRDGRILVAGLVFTFNGTERSGIARLNPNGTIDPTFTSGLPGGMRISGIGLQTDGKIVVGGNFFSYGGVSRNGIARLNLDGSLDPSFDPGSGGSNLFDIAIAPDGKIVAVGGLFTYNGTPRNGIVRINSDGTLDVSFDPGTGFGGLPRNVILADNGMILVGGDMTAYNGSPTGRVVKIIPDGALDARFISGTGSNGTVFDIEIETNGNFIVAGFIQSFNGIQRGGLVRLLSTDSATSFDFDGDGKTDVSVFRPVGGSGSEWWYLRSSDGGNRAFAFGEAADTIVPADFTGDGKTDLAFWRPALGEWFVLRSEDSTFFAFPFGAAGDVPSPADFDGDGKSDATVYRPSTNTWFTLRSSDGQVAATPFGTAGDKPVPADYDGDGKADVAIFRPTGGSGGGEWWYLRSSDGANRAFAFGTATDLTVPGDYTGDGKADVAYFRPSTGEWYVLRSEDSSFFAFPWGANGDLPAPGDYDGDGKIDAAVFRPSNSNWFALRSTAGPLILQFGTTGDRPLPNAFVR